MYSALALGLLSSFSLLGAAHPISAPKLDRRICHFDEVNPLVVARDANNAKRQSALTLTSDRPADLANALDEVWDHTKETRPNDLDFANYGYDQIIAGKGKINYCVRWESSSSVTEANRADIETAVQRSFKKWVDVLAGYDGFSYSSVDVNVVGWAVNDESLLEGSTSGIDVYTTKDSSGAPECSPDCGRFFHQDGDYSACSGGAERHYDLSLWLTDGFSGGAGGDWGQRMASDYFLGAVNDGDIHIHLHELGHTFGLDDFYDWTPTGMESFIMKAGASMTITPFDAWMARDWWTKAIKSRYPDLGSSEEVVSTATSASAAPTSAAYSSVAAPASSVLASSAAAEPASTSYALPPVVSSIPTLSSVVSAFPTDYYPAPGNGTVLPTGSTPYPTGGTGYPTGGTAYPTGSAVYPVDAAIGSTPYAAGATSWGHGHRVQKARLAATSPPPRAVKHEWRD